MSSFRIFIDRLKEGQTLPIEETTPPSFLDLEEKELRFNVPVVVSGKAYLSGDHLVLNFSAATEALMPCTICNEFFSVPLRVENFTHVEPIAEIVNHIFDYTELLRETILLEIPAFAECHGGKCPERAKINEYLRKKQEKVQDPVHFPFNDL